MVTGFSLVLYSRLHLIFKSIIILRILLVIIVVNCMLVQSPLFILAFVGAPRYTVFIKVATFLSHFEVVFAVQEVFLSSLYIYLFMKFVRQGGAKGVKYLKQTLYLLILAEVVIVVFDVALNVLLFLGWYLARRTILPFVYAFKLQIEFLVLNRLVGSRQAGGAKLKGFGVDLGNSDPLLELSRGSTWQDDTSAHRITSSESTPVKVTESFSPVLTGPSMNEVGMPIVMSRDTSASFAQGLNGTTRDMRCRGKDSMEELERRYLGRFGSDLPV
jgi:hypothetical protein